ncbi:hypothetical protein A11S_449 [Micavibrio aeruginosavorus EPB]|uniref:Uncharacterized protein n=1 Tax=Micavibrio aeruginosavorus EPB TaxID=349215 RepID=M4VGU6_9BACT|nr:hypothetical protein A11S_449 [Micavibrio aeruginosavorus EPB]
MGEFLQGGLSVRCFIDVADVDLREEIANNAEHCFVIVDN